MESDLIPDIPSAEEIDIAMGKGKKLNSLLTDEIYEGIAFLYLFPTGKNGYTVKYFIQLLLNCTQMFAAETDFILCELSVTQQFQNSNSN